MDTDDELETTSFQVKVILCKNNRFLIRFSFKPKYPHEIWFNRFFPWSSLGRVDIDQNLAISFAKLYSEDPKIPLHSDESNEKLVELLEKKWIKVNFL